jgi:hypothetical protein
MSSAQQVFERITGDVSKPHQNDRIRLVVRLHVVGVGVFLQECVTLLEISEIDGERIRLSLLVDGNGRVDAPVDLECR